MNKPILAAIVILVGSQLTGCGDPMAVSPATLGVTPRHHGELIKECTIYIKYGTREKPATFDDSAKCEMIDGLPVATFRYLQTGNYYIFGRGYDASINEPVAGGAPVGVHVGADFRYDLAVSEALHR